MQKILQSLRAALSVPLFALLLGNSMYVFSVLSMYVPLKKIANQVMFQIVINLISGISMIVALSLCGDLIPECIKDIRAAAGTLMEKYGSRRDVPSKVIFYLQRIEQKEIIYMTAGGVVQFDKQLILSALGTILTYGLLILNL